MSSTWAGSGSWARICGDLTADLGAAEAAEFDAADRAEAVEFGQQGAQGVAAVDVVGAVGGDDDEAAAAQGAEEVGQQVAGGGVGPVQVFERDDDGAVGGDALQESGGEFEEAGHALLVGSAAAAGLAQLGQQPGQLVLLSGGRGGELVGEQPAQGAQGGGERGEGQPVGADLHTAAAHEDGALADRRGGELLEQAGLPDPGLTAEQQRLRLSPSAQGLGGTPGDRTGERVVQDAEFVGAADEHRADGPGFHRPEHRTGV